jgi:hypothetical protein
MYNGYNKNMTSNKEGNLIQPLPSDELFLSNTIQMPKQFNKLLLEEGSSENEDEPDPSVIHSISSGDDENSNISNENGKKEIDSIFDFENIELPREEEHGDFRIITEFKIETLDSKEKKKVKKEKKEKKKENKNKINIINEPKIEPKKEHQKKEKKINDKKKELIKIEDDLEEEEFENNVEAWDLLKVLVLTQTKKKTSLMGGFKHILSSIIYNYKSFNDKLNKVTIKQPLTFFDSKIYAHIDINYSLFSFLYMSYRSGFFSMNCLGLGDYTSDSGWGCMLRCCQMMLSRGLVKLKLKEYQKNNMQIPMNLVIKIKKEIINLFYDGKINYNQIRGNLYLTHFFQLFQELADINGINTNITDIIPPYSIYSLCYLEKCQGVYTSDIRMIKCFVKINQLLFDLICMVHFDGYVNKKTLFETFLLINDSKNNIDKNNKEVYTYYGKEFIFNKPGLVFISLRLGLQNLDESYYETIPLLFDKIHNNIGFVSGKKNRAYYFIGYNGDKKLIFVDPHFNQKVEKFQDNSFLFSYNVPDLYILNVKELSGSLTLGIAIYCLEDFKLLLEDLNDINENFPNFIIFE